MAGRAARRAVLGRAPSERGRPGWHIECSAIALEHLGAGFDVQAGGSDLVFPHHEMCAGEAQVALPGDARSRSAYAHAGMVAYDGEKMSKSKGNLVFVSALRNSEVDPMAIRLVLLRHHYRSDWEWTDDQLWDAVDTVESWRKALSLGAGAPAGRSSRRCSPRSPTTWTPRPRSRPCRSGSTRPSVCTGHLAETSDRGRGRDPSGRCSTPPSGSRSERYSASPRLR